MSKELSQESANTKNYAPPICYTISAETQQVICASGDGSIQETEAVDEVEGIW